MATILGLFLFGSFKYQIHKNALTYGMLLIVVATFCGLRTSAWHVEIAQRGWWYWTRQHLLSFRGLDELVHADTMLFILGLTFFVSVIAQTRLLEGITFSLLRRNQGAILPTVIAVTAVVAFASGVLDGVSMIGLTIRTLVIILMLAAAPMADDSLRGHGLHRGDHDLWHLAGLRRAAESDHEGESVSAAWATPSSSSIVRPSRSRATWSSPGSSEAACAASMSIWTTMDVIDANAEDVRFLQATRHGEVMTPVELVEEHAAELGGQPNLCCSGCEAANRSASPWFEEQVPRPIRKRSAGPLRQRRTGRRPRSPLRARRRGRSRGGA